ncbi:MAG TPA: hypothetical protein VD994_12355, partial [Prosthecobacter sp.]|nr:hypothetical protein [Prosthecobacter sp.]
VLCPHCEKLVEIQVAAVTRSRACPACGEVLVLQVAEKSGTAKRKALLVAPTPPVDETNAEPLANSFEALPEDPFERMRLDPSLMALRRKFLMGVAAVVGLIVVATVAHYWEGDAPPVEVVAPKRLPAPAVEDVRPVQPAFASVSLEERIGKLKLQEELTGDLSVRKPEKLAAPVFEISNEALETPKPETAAPPVFEVSDLPTIAAPQP